VPAAGDATTIGHTDFGKSEGEIGGGEFTQSFLGQTFLVPSDGHLFHETFKFQYDARSADDLDPLATGRSTDDLRRTLTIGASVEGIDATTDPTELADPIFSGVANIDTSNNYIATWQVDTWRRITLAKPSTLGHRLRQKAGRPSNSSRRCPAFTTAGLP